MQQVQNLQTHINTQLEQALNQLSGAPAEFAEAITYVSLNQGKRLRPILTYLVGESLGVAREALDRPAIAIELIHTYSLVHDDLPCMDDADTRRGRASCHCVYDEATAVLVGDALQSMAIEILMESPHLNDSIKVQMTTELTKAIGPKGMAAGQYLDLNPQLIRHDRKQLEQVHYLKTGRLILTAARFGLLASQCQDEQIMQTITDFATTLGLAYQVRDDLMDTIGDAHELGKPTQNDQDKVTFTKLLSVEETQCFIDDLGQRAINSLQCLGKPAQPLIELTKLLLQY